MAETCGWTIWLTGLPAAGKTALARALWQKLNAPGITSVLLDSDEVRRILTPDATYTPAERDQFYGRLVDLAALLTEMRPVRWLALRSPALYLDDGWDTPKARLHDDPELFRYRRRAVDAEHNRALSACSRFTGDALLVQAEHDEIVPDQVVENYAKAFGKARSMTRRMVRGADHAFREKPAQREYTDILMAWMTEMVIGSRSAIAAEVVKEDKLQRRSGLRR